jgi:hypothetical protein
MALQICPECNSQVSTTAKSCPSCGYREKKKGYVGVIVVLLLVAIVVGYAGKRMLGENPILDALMNIQTPLLVGEVPSDARQLAPHVESYLVSGRKLPNPISDGVRGLDLACESSRRSCFSQPRRL